MWLGNNTVSEKFFFPPKEQDPVFNLDSLTCTQNSKIIPLDCIYGPVSINLEEPIGYPAQPRLICPSVRPSYMPAD
jgi:hypothetical protein